MTDDSKIAALQAQIDALKAAQPTPIDPAAEGKWRDQMHQLSEARMSQFNPFTPDQMKYLSYLPAL